MFGIIYRNILKPYFFLFDAEFVHGRIVHLGKLGGKYSVLSKFIKFLFYYKNVLLKQNLLGINFENPVGLSAGFDYNADLMGILPSVGFGFESIGTITNLPYSGNPRPRLGRLPKSRSLLVNKGFKNDGVDEIINKIKGKSFKFPVGISVGRSNSETLTNIEESIEDIAKSFMKLEKSKLKNAYYELNISCPNLIHGGSDITFYPPRNLESLLFRIDKLNLRKPLLIKMPISESNESFAKMLRVIMKHKVAGVIIGNLQKDRKNHAFDRGEITKATMGNFSGDPCYRRSNELISLTYHMCGNKLLIIGVGGIFNAYDAYEKIKLGASLVMMITGMIYEGPQVIGEINRGLTKLLSRDGYKNISEATGSTQYQVH